MMGIYSLLVIYTSWRSFDLGVYCAFNVEVIQVDETQFDKSLNREGLPHIGDLVVEVNGKPVRSWSDFLSAAADLNLPAIVGVPLTTHEVEKLADEGKTYLAVKDLRYTRLGLLREGKLLHCWSRVERQEWMDLFPSIIWFFIKLALIGIGIAIVWQRPNDWLAKLFFCLCIANVGAFMGGFHWQRIGSHPSLISIFILSGLLLPALTFHFFISFPGINLSPEKLTNFGKQRRGILVIVYSLTLLQLGTILVLLGLTVFYYRTGGEAELITLLQAIMLRFIKVSLAWSGLLFFAGLVMLVRRFLRAEKESLERKQISWILLGASLASIPIGYSLWIAANDPRALALGASTWPMFIASVIITMSYGFGIAWHGFLGVTGVLRRISWAISSSLSFGLVYGLLVYFSSLLLNHGEVGVFGSPLWGGLGVSVTAWVVLTAIDLVRGRLRLVFDQRLDKTRYLLDQTFKQMNQTLTQQLDSSTIAKRLCLSLAEIVECRQVMVYLSTGESYKLAASLKPAKQPELTREMPLVNALLALPMVRCRVGTSIPNEPAQKQLKWLGGELALPLKHENELLAIAIISTQETPEGIDIEKLHVLTSVTQLASLALHSTQGSKAMESLNRELQEKVQKISEQQRRIVTLQSQLLRLGANRPVPSEAGAGESVPVEISSEVFATSVEQAIVGSSNSIRQLLNEAKKVASSMAAVLVRGESGTGKELVARLIHEGSQRAKGPFVRVHCAALAPGLLESELFGHVKGAFTGAVKDKPGRFELADKGTLFLDEIGDISLEVQTKLLRVLQEMTFERVGSTQSMTVDVRIVAATHQDLERLMKEGKFREDLYYRLNVVTLRTPPLRSRTEDIIELAEHFIRLYSLKMNKPMPILDDDALVQLRSYPWPGNIRELENAMERAVVLAEGPIISISELPVEVRGVSSRVRSSPSITLTDVPVEQWQNHFDEQEKQRLLEALAKAGGNKAKAARLLDMKRSTYISRLERFGLVK